MDHYRFHSRLGIVQQLQPEFDLASPLTQKEKKRKDKNKQILAIWKNNLDKWTEEDRQAAAAEAEGQAQAIEADKASKSHKTAVRVAFPTANPVSAMKKTKNRKKVGFFDLPVEVLENICVYLDGPSLFRLKKTSVYVGQLVDEALNSHEGFKFWRSRSLAELPPLLMMRALVCFNTLVGVDRRRYYQRYIDSFPKNPKRYTWKDVYTVVQTMQDKLESLHISMEILHTVQEVLKNEVRIGFKKKARAGYPFVNVTTHGSLLIYNQVPCSNSFDLQHGYVFEDMKCHRRSYKILGKGERVLYTKFMDVPIGTNPSDFPGNSLPKPRTVIIIATVLRLCLFDSRDGERHSIYLSYPLPYALSERMPAMIAIEGNYLGIWVHPDSYCLYKISVDPVKGTPDSTLIMDVMLQGAMEQFWSLVRLSPYDYLPLFEKRVASRSFLENDLPIYTIVSPRYFNFSILHDQGEPDAFGRINGRVEIESPKFPEGKELDQVQRRRLKLTGKAAGFGRALFWSDTTLYVMYNDIEKRFLYREWPDYKFGFEKEQELVKMAEVIGENLIMIYTGAHILISTLDVRPPIIFKWKLPHAHVDVGKIDMNLVRRIEMRAFTLSFPNPMEIKHFHFDFDKGIPYIFCVWDQPFTKSPYTYQLMKLEFVDPNAEKEPEKVDEPIYVSHSKFPRRKHPRFNELTKEVLAEVTDPWIVALLQALSVYDEVQ